MKRVVVVDDDGEVRAALHAVLSEEGYNVMEAANGVEAIRLLKSQPIDVMILDILMEEMDGLETISALNREGIDVKTIAISGGGVFDSRFCLTTAKKLGALRTITKPFERAEIIESVKDLLEGTEQLS